ncbi:hypothetical protein QBC38DRAFT_455663 [Podospora fimiseda]|uniref:Uncharacterized protein n=1 Tax=Podospora fimiseda TaxID=252190 RepID=A0AAN7GYD6_9PEZI|nr:hypothetical protein QBC38DRAFT_455663 [Podospora fimiseda]
MDDAQREAARELSSGLGGSPLYFSYAQGQIKSLDLSLVEYPNFIQKRSNLLPEAGGTALNQINDFDGVRENLKVCMEQYNIWGPEDNKALEYEYGKYYNQMAYALLWENKPDEAVAYAERAYKFVDKGASNTALARIHQADYSHILFQQGSQAQALSILVKL